MPEPDVAAAVAALDALTRRLRRECPWDREQDERSIVPHTVEESYELADAAHRGDDAKLLDELGDVLFQVHFLALLLEERGAGSLAEVAEHCRQGVNSHFLSEMIRRLMRSTERLSLWLLWFTIAIFALTALQAWVAWKTFTAPSPPVPPVLDGVYEPNIFLRTS